MKKKVAAAAVVWLFRPVVVQKRCKVDGKGAVIDGWRMEEEVTLETAGYCRFPAVHGRFFGSGRWAIDERG
uniref:Uncharacterized protein n=1 Tax=Solanum tuberosum TaxID=4113 RepID=M1A331_SOLTU